jgi:hypothetical protein
MIRGSRQAEPILDEGAEEEEGDEAEEEEEANVVHVETGRITKMKRKRNAGTRGPRWKSLEDEWLIEAWDPITSANQASGKYYKRIFDQSNERKQ